jgi:hypothetical protein
MLFPRGRAAQAPAPPGDVDVSKDFTANDVVAAGMKAGWSEILSRIILAGV